MKLYACIVLIALAGMTVQAQPRGRLLANPPTLIIEDEGVALAAQGRLNFIGAGVSCVSNLATLKIDCNFSGVGGGVADPGANGLMKRTSLNVTAPAVAGTDYVIPGGNVATATALAANPTNCTTGNHPLGIDASGNAEGCTADSGGVADPGGNGLIKRTALNVTAPAVPGTDYVIPAGNVATATALAATPTLCTAGTHPLGVLANGNATSCTADSGGSGNMLLTSGTTDPTGACTAGTAQYLQTTTQDEWFCAVSGTWKKKLSTTNTGTYLSTGLAGTVPATPATGYVTEYFDSTAKVPQAVDDAGAKSTMVRPLAAVASNWIRSIGTDGLPTASRPAWADISGTPAVYDKATWSLCVGTPCTTGANLTNLYIVVAAQTLSKCYAAAKTAPTTTSLIVDVLKSGTSIFGAGTKLVIAGGATSGTQATIANTALVEGDQLTVSITQIGSGVAGQDLTVVCKSTL